MPWENILGETSFQVLNFTGVVFQWAQCLFCPGLLHSYTLVHLSPIDLNDIDCHMESINPAFSSIYSQ